jgi:adenosylcobinamide kinase/adenosylcobinamide-phosphate guanylyltransferase
VHDARKSLTLIIGGARSGKSSLAEQMASGHENVLFVATAEASDEDMAARIAAHQAARPDEWDTLEEPHDPAAALVAVHTSGDRYDVIVIDCLTVWAANLMLADGPAPPDYDAETATLIDVYESGDTSWIVVTNEVGMGVVPPSESGRDFRDALGRVNGVFARRADRVISMTAGLALDLKELGARPWNEFAP